ncbi:MAG: uracil-DNA glycosylase [Bacteroidaceae bacterium]|nr:uracil-DNA glycosylase [Bacteroidaceae bacterium]
MKLSLPETWNLLLSAETVLPYFQTLSEFVEQEYATSVCYPAAENIFRAFELCPPWHVKTVILGQDPYHEPGQAQGLSFSVPIGMKLPPSLKNIFKELASDLSLPLTPQCGDLTPWARQGVLLLNATLTVREHQANSHADKGWETFTDAVISKLSNYCAHTVFMLWGNYARSKAHLIDSSKHLVLASAHPSPLSAWQGFFGNHHFSQTNQFLLSNGLLPIDWSTDTQTLF